jgi:hypothetical protein
LTPHLENSKCLDFIRRVIERYSTLESGDYYVSVALTCRLGPIQFVQGTMATLLLRERWIIISGTTFIYTRIICVRIRGSHDHPGNIYAYESK